MLVVPELNGVTTIVAEDEPSANVTCVVDSEITDVSKPVRFNVNPPGGAGLVTDIVSAPVTPGTFNRLIDAGVKLMFFGAAVIVTVAGSPLMNPSFTINCTM